MENILNQISNAIPHSNSPIIKPIYDKGDKKLLAIGLCKGVTFPEHMALSKAKILVVQGEIDFNTATHSYRLQRFDTFEVPVKLKHSVLGVFDAIFLLMLFK
ncbi:MAG: hypothetical protein ACSHW7_12960 [Patiriisocius sp.]|uniref:hypothetical protein n=1 Tax=Patiriisocius sp. TaxID=2822396 RepID=UPI003EF787F9